MSYNPYGFQQQVPFQQSGFQAQGFQQQEQPPAQLQSVPAQFQHPLPPSTPSQERKYDQLSFLSEQDQVKFERLFNRHTDAISISPDSARSILLKSNLAPHNLARIWELSDINKTGDLLFPEFALALHLCNVVLSGAELPYQLEPRIKNEVSNLVDKINFNVPEGGAVSTQQSAHSTGALSDGDIFETNPVSGIQPQGQQQQTFQQQTLQQQPTFGSFQQPELFTSPQKNQNALQQNDFTSPLNNQPTGFGFQNTPFTQGFNQGSTPPLSSNIMSNTVPLTQQPPRLVPLKSETTGVPIQRQQTGLPTSFQLQQANAASDLIQTTPGEIAALNAQATGLGLVPLKMQQTGTNAQMPLASQSTGFASGVMPTTFQTGGQSGVNAPLQQQATGLIPLNSQATGSQPLQRQPTGLIPLNTQATGSQPLQRQPTGLVPLNTQATGSQPLQRQPTGLVPLNSQATGQQSPPQPQNLIPIPTGGATRLQPQTTGLVPLRTGNGQFEPLKAQKTGFGQNSFFITNLVAQSQNYVNSYSYLTDAKVTPEEKKLFNKIFDNYDTEKKGLLSSDICAEIFRKSGLNREDLEKVWDLIARPNQTHLDRETFQMGMWLVYKRLNGAEIPNELPDSLKPSSMLILDDVKNKMRVQDSLKPLKKSSHSKIDGSRFKNNDDELITSSARHRRRAAATDKVLHEEKLNIEQMKKLINEKKILLDAFEVQREEDAVDNEEREREDLLAIETLKQQLRNLPKRTVDDERTLLKSKVQQLTDNAPYLIGEILSMEKAIQALKLELFRLNNPSALIGTGPNGEITDADRRKAKSKLLLAQKMAKLTGKPIDPNLEKLAEDATSLSTEAVKIQEESSKNQQMIRDVESSIKDISSSVLKELKVNVDNDEYKKWVLGVGVHPEVQQIVKEFRVEDIKERVRPSAPIVNPPVYESPVVSPPANIPPAISSPAEGSPTVGSPANVSSFQTVSGSQTERSSSRPTFSSAEERKAYIKEQAKKKMQERMAALGLKRSTRTPSVESSTISTPTVSSPLVDEDGSSSDDDEESYQRMEEIRRRNREEREARMKEHNV